MARGRGHRARPRDAFTTLTWGLGFATLFWVLVAPVVAVVATLEPVLASVIAWVLHDQALAATQIAGGAVVLTAIAWLQTHGSGSLDPWTSSSPEGTVRSAAAS